MCTSIEHRIAWGAKGHLADNNTGWIFGESLITSCCSSQRSRSALLSGRGHIGKVSTTIYPFLRDIDLGKEASNRIYLEPDAFLEYTLITSQTNLTFDHTTSLISSTSAYLRSRLISCGLSRLPHAYIHTHKRYIRRPNNHSVDRRCELPCTFHPSANRDQRGRRPEKQEKSKTERPRACDPSHYTTIHPAARLPAYLRQVTERYRQVHTPT